MNVEQENGLRLERAVMALCPAIRSQIEVAQVGPLTEEYLRQEMAACILSPQVRFEMVDAAMTRLTSAGLFEDTRWNGMSDATFEDTAFNALADRVTGERSTRGSYRFPRSRAGQLALMRRAVEQSSQSLRHWLHPSRNARTLRQELVSYIPGFGPKLASMYLRNCGLSYELAVLDTHTLRFMAMRGLISPSSPSIATLRRYEEMEARAVDYAANLGHPVGYLDWAIWATMRAAKELRL